jgi:hypothetical protein
MVLGYAQVLINEIPVAKAKMFAICQHVCRSTVVVPKFRQCLGAIRFPPQKHREPVLKPIFASTHNASHF